MNPNEKENLNILLGFILTKLGDEEKRSKDDKNLTKIKNLKNYDIIYVPQKTINSEKENEILGNLLKFHTLN